MFKFIGFLSVLFIGFFANAQEDVGLYITGKWQVISIANKPEDKNLAKFVNGFENAIFSFNEDKSFNIKIVNKNDLMLMLTNKIKNKKWFVNKNKTIKIGSKKDYILGIEVIVNDGTTYFKLLETDLILQMKRP